MGVIRVWSARLEWPGSQRDALAGGDSSLPSSTVRVSGTGLAGASETVGVCGCSATSPRAHRPGRRLHERQPAGHRGGAGGGLPASAQGTQEPLGGELVPQAPDHLPGRGSELRKPQGDLPVTPGLRGRHCLLDRMVSLRGPLVPSPWWAVAHGRQEPTPQQHPDLPMHPSPQAICRGRSRTGVHVSPRAAHLRTLSSWHWASVLCPPRAKMPAGQWSSVCVALALPQAELGSREAWAEAPCLCLLLPPPGWIGWGLGWGGPDCCTVARGGGGGNWLVSLGTGQSPPRTPTQLHSTDSPGRRPPRLPSPFQASAGRPVLAQL